MPPDDVRVLGPEDDQVALHVVHRNGSSTIIDKWKEYRTNSHFLVPTDGFSFVVAKEALRKNQVDAIIPGAEVKLLINNSKQMAGYVDEVSYNATRHGGVEIRVDGRDKLSPVVDSCMDPTVQFKDGMTLEQLLRAVFEPFGISKFSVDPGDNRGVLTGNVHGTKTSKKGKPLKSELLHQLRPYPNEGAFAFAARVCQRKGLWLWLSADGETLLVGKPTFDQPSSYKLRRDTSGTNDILSGTVSYNLSEQPSVIVADGFSGGGEFGRSRMRAICENPALDCDNSEIIAKFKNAQKVELAFSGAAMRSRLARPLFLHDDEAKTPEQLDAYVRREMSLRLRQSLTARFTVFDHVKDGSYWSVDTIVDVRDEVSGLKEKMWVLSRTFVKSRSGGTTTELELVRPYSLDF